MRYAAGRLSRNVSEEVAGCLSRVFKVTSKLVARCATAHRFELAGLGS